MKDGIKKIAVIGGGASGILSAILIKKHCKCDVTIFEKQNRILKKVLNTGNGMCNITNEQCNTTNNILNYYNTDKIKGILDAFNVNKFKEVLDDLGLIIVSDDSGRYYPYSKKASSVIDVLLREIDRLNINVIVDREIVDIKEGFSIRDNLGMWHNFDYIIVSCGGKSSINFENRMYDVLKKLGHAIVSTNASLVGFKTKENIKSLSGIRIKANVNLYKDKNIVASSLGEVQFKDDGISGICVMELSRFYDKGNYFIELDLMNEYNENDLKELIRKYYKKYNNLNECLVGMLPKMLANEIGKKCNDIDELIFMIKHFRLSILDTYGFKFSQVTRGGVSLGSVDINTLESKILKNLYICGEVLDVDGTCGGYNLHFAWASAYAVASNIIRSVGEKL